MNELTKEKVMTVKEVAEILQVTIEVLKWHIRKLYPELLYNNKLKIAEGYKLALEEIEKLENKLNEWSK